MPDFSLVPVDYQPDFDDFSLVPLDHDPFADDGVMQQAPQVQAQAQPSPMPTQPQSLPQQPATADSPNASPSSSASDIQVAANDGMPGNNQAQNAQVRAIQVELGLSDDQRERLHQEISGQGLGYHAIRQIAIEMFGK